MSRASEDWDDLQERFRAWVQSQRKRLPWLRPGHVEVALHRIERVDGAFDLIVRSREYGMGSRGVRVVVPRTPNGSPTFDLQVRTNDAEDRLLFSFDIDRRRWDRMAAREAIEEALRVWPGFVDGIEAVADEIGEVVRWADETVRRERAQMNEERAQFREMTMESAVRQYGLGRHPALELWRRQNPVERDKVPTALRAVRHVKRLRPEHPCHVYFLLNEGEVVYVGRTAATWPARIVTHMKDPSKHFDDVWHLEVDAQSMDRVEAEMIRRFRPRYNVRGIEE